MINSLEEKKIHEIQIQRLENALYDLKTHAESNPVLFKTLSKPYIQKIKILRNEIENFLKINDYEEAHDIVIRISGKSIGNGSAPISIVSKSLKSIKSAISNTYATIEGIADFHNLPKYITEASDFSMIGTSQGSIQLLLDFPITNSLFSENELEDVFTIFFKAASWAENELDYSYFKEIVPNRQQREVIIKQLIKLTPAEDDERIESIQYYGAKIDKSIVFSKSTREHLKQFISTEEEVTSYIGIVREIDLDKKSFILREIEHDIIKEIRCKVNNSLESLPKLNNKIKVIGIEKSNTKNPIKLDLESFIYL